MLLVADIGLRGVLSQAEPPAYVRRGFGRLLQAYLDGLHLCVIHPELCRLIEASNLFSVDEKAAAGKARIRYAEHGALPSMLGTFARVVDTTVACPVNNANVWELPLRWIADRPLRETQLVAEDLRDIAVLLGAAEDYKTSIRYLAFRVRVGRAPGGGGNTHRLLTQAALHDQQICLCVVDSDRECPTSPLGPSATACLAVTGPGIFELRVTQGRTLENAIPWRLVDALRPHNVPPPATVFAELERVHAGSSRFLNLKRGCFQHDLHRLAGTSCGDYWTTVAGGFGDGTVCCESGCEAVKVGSCRRQILPGFGNALLSETAAWLDETAHDPARRTAYLPSPNADEWRDLGKHVFEYGLGMSPSRF